MERIIVVGGGLIGCTAAAALAVAFPDRMTHIAPATEGDERTTALLMDAIQLLDELGVWRDVEPHAARLRTMRLLDGSRRLLRARPLDFPASEIGLSEFGYNIPNERLVEALREVEGLERVDDTLVRMERTGSRWRLTTAEGRTLEADAVVAADGRNSLVRESLGIGARRWTYEQVALVTTFAHDVPHEGISTEFHTETGPFTQVPLPGKPNEPHRSSLVWVVHPSEVAGLRALDMGEASRRIAERMGYVFGDVSVERPLAGYPLAGLVADAFGRDGAFLVGEAAHVFPPIGAQGANLGFRDIADARDSLVSCADPIAASDDYARRRRADVGVRTAAVDALNRSLLTGFLPVHVARALGTSILSGSRGLRRRVMQAGLAPARQPGNGSTGSAPVVMR